MPNPVHGAAIMGKYVRESKIINTSFDGDYINLSTSQHGLEVGKAGMRKVVNLIKIQIKVLKALISKNYDVTYLTLTAKGPGFYKDLMIVVILKLFRKKIIYHFHNKGVSERQNNILDHLLYKFTFTNTKSILLSQYLYDDIKKYVKKENVFLCPNGSPLTKDLGREILLKKTRSNTPNVGARILFLSNMMKEKGVLVLIEACKILKQKTIPFDCHFVGAWLDVSEEKFSNIIRNNNLTDCVFAHGEKYGEEKNLFFHNSDIFVFPTYYHNETFGLVIIEALEFALPVVSTPEGGIPDVIIDGETGFLIPQQNAVALAEKIEILIKKPELRLQMGMAGKKRFEQLFTFEIFENRLSDILKQAIKL
jgi:glycosyltransferase involved in cell wall biosynthesis